MAKQPKVKPSLESVTTIREDGSRLFLHPADVKGVLTTARRLSGWAMVLVFLLLPVIRVGGYPAVFFNVAERRFHLFGNTLAFQDTWLLFFVVSGLGFTLFFVTSLFGRLWCGWTCPHTVFLDHVYRRIERLIEGDANRRRALDAAPWSTDKIIKRVLKQTLFVLVSAVIAHTLLAYFISFPVLLKWVWATPFEHLSAFIFVWVVTGALYFNFAWFREQLCLIICPYGRLQSAMIDDNSMVVGYDVKRGEPRGRVGKEGVGDCINCMRCVEVCPTGIDIRQGLQMECVSCESCIDACNEIMFKIGRPKGLIRHDSIAGFEGEKTRWIRPRTVVYLLLLCLGIAATGVAVSSIKPVVAAVTRMTGTSYAVDKDAVRNQFMVRLVNKQSVPLTLEVDVTGGPQGLQQTGLIGQIELEPLAEVLQPLVLRVPIDDYNGPFTFQFNVRSQDAGSITSVRSEFIGPEADLLRRALRERAQQTAADNGGIPLQTERVKSAGNGGAAVQGSAPENNTSNAQAAAEKEAAR